MLKSVTPETHTNRFRFPKRKIVKWLTFEWNFEFLYTLSNYDGLLRIKDI